MSIGVDGIGEGKYKYGLENGLEVKASVQTHDL